MLGTTSFPADQFPIDDRGNGFDNMADVLTLSPLHLSVYYTAAKNLATEALQNPTQRAALLKCDLAADGTACQQQTLKDFAYRAWRRPVTDAEVTRLLAVADAARSKGESAETGLNLALRAVLLSPHFVFRVELDPDPTSATPHPLSAYELASRLSYFLWSSTPDAALLASAEAGTLTAPTTLREQATRLLQDERARALVDNFAGQWLHLRAVDGLQPDPKLFPGVDGALLSAMKAETELLFRDIAFKGTPILDLLTANYSYINDRLASHYGLPAVGGSELKRVDLSGNAERGGLLTQGSFLALTSHVNRTSPVVRGKWVMDELLCATVPPPPPDVNLAAVSMAKEQGLTQRQALEAHRADPKCAACHQLMDPIGLGLENYDAIGSYRTMDAGHPIDAAGKLPSGETFAGAKELAARIAAKPELARCVAKKLYAYALGRPAVETASHLDGVTVESLAQALSQNGYSFGELVSSIITSPAFTSRSRRTERRHAVKRISRRLLLGGSATLLGLPFLESALPRAARAAGETAPVRLVYIYVPNGLDMATFRPATVGRDYTLPPMFAGLDALKDDFSIVTGLENVAAKPDGPGDHASGTSSFITCAHAFKSETDIMVGASADQIAAKKIGQATRLPSLQLGIDGGGAAGGCDNGYSCAYTCNISWADASTPLPKIVDPAQAFDQLFQGYDANASAAEAQKRRDYDKSVIDFVLADVNGLEPKLGATDKGKLDQYLTGVRELEKRLVGLGPGVSCTPGNRPGMPVDYRAHVKAMMDLITLAFACDATRIVTLMFGNGISGRTHPFLDITGGHHDISHHMNDAGLIAQLAKIGAWEMQQLGYLFDKLKAQPDADGQSVLYNSAVFCSSDISDGNRHNHDDMPVVLGGHAGGKLKPGQHVKYPSDKSMPKQKVSNLLVTMLESAGVTGAQVGDSSGALTEL